MEKISDLFEEINYYKQIKKNTKKFINHYNLTVYPVKKSQIQTYLPFECYLGVVYLIKNNSIIEFNSNLCARDNDSQRSPKYRCLSTIHSIDISDVIDFMNPDTFLNTDEIISSDIEKTINFIVALIKTDFKLYVQNA